MPRICDLNDEVTDIVEWKVVIYGRCLSDGKFSRNMGKASRNAGPADESGVMPINHLLLLARGWMQDLHVGGPKGHYQKQRLRPHEQHEGYAAE